MSLPQRALHRESGPLAVFGAQAGYFQPELLWTVDAHGPGFDVRGAKIPGTGPYVELGRGRYYAWSATSAGQDITDVYALDLGNADDSKGCSPRPPTASAAGARRWRPSIAGSAGRRAWPTRRPPGA